MEGYTDGERWCSSSDGWADYQVDVSAYVGPDFRVMFRLHSDYNWEAQGMYIDDVTLSQGTVVGDTDSDTEVGQDTDTDVPDTDTQTGDTDTDTQTTGQFACYGFVPTVLPTATQTFLNVVGEAFETGLTGVLVDPNGVNPSVSLGAASLVQAGGARFDISDTLLTIADSYEVHLTGVDAEAITCDGLVTVTTPTVLSVTSVLPALVWEGDAGDGKITDKEVTIAGGSFNEVPKVTWVGVDNPGLRYQAPVVYFDDANQIRATCPADTQGMPAGEYYVYVQNFGSGVGGDYWMESSVLGRFTITSSPPPKIDTIEPYRAPASTPPEDGVDISGEYFHQNTTVHLVDYDGTLILLPSTPPDSEGIINAQPPSSLSQGIYPMRVTNPDGQYTEFYYYGATSGATAHLEDFLEVPGSELITGRWRNASVEGFDPFLGSYIYTTGGMGRQGTGETAVDVVLDDVEIVPISIRGTPGTHWEATQWDAAQGIRIDNTLRTPRQGHALVRSGSWIYALGGANEPTNTVPADAGSAVNALATVERAKILGFDTMPLNAIASVDEGGSLAAGVWYYQVSAVGSWGESLPSLPIIVYADAPSIVTLTWERVPGAEGYNVYRNATETGDSGVVYLLDEVIGDTTYIDDAQSSVNTAIAPLPRGSLSLWVEDDVSMTTGREGLAGVAMAIRSTSTKRLIYAIGGRETNLAATEYLRTTEVAEVGADGSLYPFNLLTVEMNDARAFFPVVSTLGQDSYIGPSSDPGEGPLETGGEIGDLMLVAVQGDDQYVETNNGIITIELTSIIKENGLLDTWVEQEFLMNGKDSLGLDAQLFFDHLFIFNGAASERYSNAVSDYRYRDPDPINANQKRVSFEVWRPDAEILQNSQGGGGSDFVPSRCYYDTVRLNGYIFVLGGNDGTGPLATINRIEQ